MKVLVYIDGTRSITVDAKRNPNYRDEIIINDEMRITIIKDNIDKIDLIKVYPGVRTQVEICFKDGSKRLSYIQWSLMNSHKLMIE